MNVKSDKFYVNGQTSSNSNLNSRWNFVIKVGCFEISFMCRTHSWYSHYFIFGISVKFDFFFEKGPEWHRSVPPPVKVLASLLYHLNAPS